VIAAVVGARVRARRQAEAVSLAELARRSGVARATLTELEAGAGNPTLETLYALANALGVPLSDLITEPPAPVRVVRAGEGPHVRGAALEGRLVERVRVAGAVVELFALRVLAGRTHRSGPHPPGTREHLLVHTGRARVGPVGAAAELGPGDLVAFDATEPHEYAALGEADAEATLLIVSAHAPG
jgi:transcriptional regulator with XRE-family HTH domain